MLELKFSVARLHLKKAIFLLIFSFSFGNKVHMHHNVTEIPLLNVAVIQNTVEAVYNGKPIIVIKFVALITAEDYIKTTSHCYQAVYLSYPCPKSGF